MDMMPQEPVGMGEMPMNNMGGDDPMMDANGGTEEPMEGEGTADDPKKNIQRLAGELSQALRTYNDEQQSPDTDLNKYVVGMIATQAGKNMTSDEKNEIVKKIQKGETVDDNVDDDMAMEECKQNTVMNDGRDDKRYDKRAVKLKNNPFSSKR
jgi:hypothetical protein